MEPENAQEINGSTDGLENLKTTNSYLKGNMEKKIKDNKSNPFLPIIEECSRSQWYLNEMKQSRANKPQN